MQKQAKGKINTKEMKPYSEKSSLPKTEILGVGVTNASKENILEFVVNSLQKKQNPYYIVTPNPEMLVAADKNPTFQKVLNGAKIALNDGVGVRIAAWFLGKHLHSRFTGVQLVEKLCEKCNDWPITVGFLGAGPKVAEKASKCLKLRYPNLKIVFVNDYWPGEETILQGKESGIMNKELWTKNQREKIIIHNSKFIIHPIDILFVAFGAPKQEFWMQEHLHKIPVKVMVGVGGALDQIANPSLRPPKVLEALGLGWLYRLIRQPWRWKRQLALLEFVGMVIQERIQLLLTYF